MGKGTKKIPAMKIVTEKRRAKERILRVLAGDKSDTELVETIQEIQELEEDTEGPLMGRKKYDCTLCMNDNQKSFYPLCLKHERLYNKVRTRYEATVKQ